MASQILFGRSYSLTVGPKNQTGLLIKDLRISFQVEKSLEPFPNTCTIEIYNLSAASRSTIEEKHSAMILSAGYGTNLKTVFIGDIGKVDTKRHGADITLSLEAGDGRVPYLEARFDGSFSEGVRMGAVIDTLTKAFGLAKGQIQGLNLADQFQHGLSLSGSVREHMNMLMKRQGLEWNIQDGQLQILPPDVGSTEEVILLNADTGLIGTPYKTKILNEDLIKKKDGIQGSSGVKCLSLLNPEIRPGRKIKLESSTVNGVFKVRKVRLTGDTHATPWYTEVEAV